MLYIYARFPPLRHSSATTSEMALMLPVCCGVLQALLLFFGLGFVIQLFTFIYIYLHLFWSDLCFFVQKGLFKLMFKWVTGSKYWQSAPDSPHQRFSQGLQPSWPLATVRGETLHLVRSVRQVSQTGFTSLCQTHLVRSVRGETLHVFQDQTLVTAIVRWETPCSTADKTMYLWFKLSPQNNPFDWLCMEFQQRRCERSE